MVVQTWRFNCIQQINNTRPDITEVCTSVKFLTLHNTGLYKYQKPSEFFLFECGILDLGYCACSIQSPIKENLASPLFYLLVGERPQIPVMFQNMIPVQLISDWAAHARNVTTYIYDLFEYILPFDH